MNIIVTGGAGFIGSNIVKLLVKNGHMVKVIDNLATGYKQNLDGLGVELLIGDVKDPEFLTKALNGCDCVYHLAASVGNIKSIENPYFDLETNYIGTLNLLTAVVKNNVSRVVYSSSSAGYGEPRYIPVDEDHPIAPDSPYGVSKISAEKLIHSYAKLYDFRAVSLRYFNAYGVNQRYDAYGNVIPIFYNKILSGQSITIYGDGEQTRDFINAEDIAAANLLALEYGKNGIFNIATGDSATINRLVDTIKNTTGREFEVIYTEARRGEVKHSGANIEAAKKELGFSPKVDLEAGLKKYTEWFFNEFASTSK